MRIIPSLDGSLFAYYTTGDSKNVDDRLEKIPFNLEDLLKTSIRLNNKLTIIGGILTQTLGIDLTTGQVCLSFVDFYSFNFKFYLNFEDYL
jgi:hypothetical protein